MQDVEPSPVDVAQSDGERPSESAGPAARTRRRPRNIGLTICLVVLGVGVIYALISLWLRFYTFDPKLGSFAREEAGIQIDPAVHPWFFPWLMLHIVCASIALAAAALQVWPWLRRNHRRAHRNIGRTYVYAGVYPSAVAGLVIEAFWPFSIVTSIQQAVLSVLWLATTFCGHRLIKQRRIDDHRRWMLRSFALTTTPLVITLLAPPIEALLRSDLHARLADSQLVLAQVSAASENWVAMLVAILAVEWWLERERLRRSARRQRLSSAPRKPGSDARATAEPPPSPPSEPSRQPASLQA